MQQLSIYKLTHNPIIHINQITSKKEEKKEEEEKTYILKLNPEEEKSLWNLPACFSYGTVCQNTKQISSDSIEWEECITMTIRKLYENRSTTCCLLFYRIRFTYYYFLTSVACIIFFLSSNSSIRLSIRNTVSDSITTIVSTNNIRSSIPKPETNRRRILELGR